MLEMQNVSRAALMKFVLLPMSKTLTHELHFTHGNGPKSWTAFTLSSFDSHTALSFASTRCWSHCSL